jgi:hypothetical protein
VKYHHIDPICQNWNPSYKFYSTPTNVVGDRKEVEVVMMTLWATVQVEIYNDKYIRVVDCESLELHYSEHNARKHVAKELRQGTNIVALLQLDGLYTAGEIEIVKMELPK